MQLNYEFLSSVFIFAIIISGFIGPIAIIIINISVKVSLRSGFRCALGASMADLTCAIVAFFLYSSILIFVTEYKQIFDMASSIVLMALGLYIGVSAFINTKPDKKGHSKNFSIIADKPFSTLYLLTLASPTTIPIFTAFICKTNFDLTIADKIFGVLVLFFVSLAVQCLIAIFANSAKKYLLKDNVIRYFNIVCGFTIVIYAAKELF